MNRQELLEEIRRLESERGISREVLAWDDFIEQPDYAYLRDAFHKNRIGKEKWHQAVRFAFSDPKEHRYMYERLLQLLLKYRQSYADYFNLKTETGTVALPDRRSDLNRLFILYKEFFDVFKNITNRIHFDYPIRQSSEQIIRGKIDWQETFRKYPTGLPLQFEIYKWVRNFAVPENFLLIIGANFLYQEATRLLQMEFAEPLDHEERSILNTIATNMQNGISNFPFSTVISEASRFFGLSINDRRIIELESAAESRIKQGFVKNPTYKVLISWIRRLRELNIRMVSASKTNFPLETIENLDTIYEAWLFFEFINFFYERGWLSKVQLDDEPNYFELDFEGHRLRFFYERQFTRGNGPAWALNSKPDFTVLEDENIIAVFDAKNYGKDSEQKREATNKMLAYMTNLDADFGALFFPNFKTAVFKFPPENYRPKHHDNLQLIHYQMKPSETEDALKIKNESLSSLWEEIARKLKLPVRQA